MKSRRITVSDHRYSLIGIKITSAGLEGVLGPQPTNLGPAAPSGTLTGPPPGTEKITPLSSNSINSNQSVDEDPLWLSHVHPKHCVRFYYNPATDEARMQAPFRYATAKEVRVASDLQISLEKLSLIRSA
jgi:hypothetical protein